MSKSKGKSAHSMAGQPTISSFFSQSPLSPAKTRRPFSPVDLTIDSDSGDERQAKRRRTTTSNFFSSSIVSQAQAGSSRTEPRDAGAAEKYRFNPTSLDVEHPRTQAEGIAQKKRRERAKKILLGDKSILSRRASEDSEHHDMEGPEDEEAIVDDDSGDDSDAKFKDTLAFFASTSTKSKSRKKSSKVSAPKKLPEIGPSGLLYTALELQVRDLKKKYPGTILMFEVGYKFRFFGEDAPIAAKELGIVAFQARNFMNASIPVHRRDVHLKKLLSQGYKVGIVGQTETAALKKVGDTRNELFSRELTHLYTAATYVDRLGSVDEMDPTAAPPLMCLVEELRGGMGADERVCISMIAISPSTGDVVWDQFEDNHMRTELETRMVHTSPCELLLPKDKLSKPTEKMLSYFTEHSTAEHKTRIERYKDTLTYTEAFSYLTKFYSDKAKHAVASESFTSGKLMAAVADFPKQVVIALAHVVKYLSTFEVADALLETKFFAKFTERTHMLLNGNTLTNLEIYRNETDFNKKGSLLWILDHTTTRFGARMLRAWAGRPLTDTSALKERTDAIEEILASHSANITILRQLLKGLPDLARGLCRIQYGKCTPEELAILLPAFNKIAVAFQSVEKPEHAGFKSSVLNNIVYSLPKLRDPIQTLLNTISVKMASEGRKDAMWSDPDKFPDIEEITVSMQIIESELMDELKSIRKTVKKPALQYTTWNVEEYVIEIKKNENRDIPYDWTLLSSTKTARRYHPPNVKKKLEQRAQFKEALDAEANRAFQSFLAEIAHKYYAILRDAVNKLAVADCLLSLALVAVQEGYVRPIFCDNEDTLEIIKGRHPMIEALRDAPFVPNTVNMGGGQPRSKIITGPNMGGKSSAVRMIALCAIMAQIGSYVPAVSMKMSMLDGILIRMGASDELARGRSTFMVEMQETSDILRLASPDTLVILDELGRGTSTFDGMAVASAVLQQLVQVTKCKTLFITHYPKVATDLERTFPRDIENLHMGFAEDTRVDGTREVTFLYKLTPGIAMESFGVECARLAGIPESVLQVAATRSQEMRALVERRIKRNKIRKCTRLLQKLTTSTTDGSNSQPDDLHALLE